MKTFNALLFSMLFGISASAFAADAPTAKTDPITITGLADDAELKAGVETKFDYVINPGPTSDHAHFYIGNKDGVTKAGDRGEIVRSFKGSYTLPKLAAGAHSIVMRVVNSNHTPVGIEKTIKFTVTVK